MADIVLHSTTIAPYSLGPAHALLALNAERREHAVNLLQGLRLTYGAHEGFNLRVFMCSVPEEQQQSLQQSFWDLATSGALLLAVTPLPRLPTGEESTA